MAKRFSKSRRPRRRTPRTGRSGKFSSSHKSKIGRPSRGLTASRYFFAERVVTTVPNLKDGPMPNTRWTNNAGLTQTMHDGVFQLSDLANFAKYQTLFEAYKINAVKIQFIPQGTIAQTGVPDSDQVIVYNWTDYLNNYSGGGSMPTQAELLAMQRCRKRQLITGKPLNIYTKCKQQNVALLTSAGSYAYTQQKPKWISTAQDTANHYSINTVFCAQSGGVLPTYPVQMVTTYYLEFRGQK